MTNFDQRRQHVGGNQYNNIYEIPPPPPNPQIEIQKKNNRSMMLERLNIRWRGVLKHSLHGMALIDLNLQVRFDLIENPWGHMIQETDQSPCYLPPGTSISQVYDDTGKGLLILGEPGSGKTTLLWQLACDLIERAKQVPTHPMPVVFNLSSWAIKRRPIAEWLVEELSSKYLVQQKDGKVWVDENQVLPLLDGLDEVAKEYRAACVDAINAYLQKRSGLVPLVVCSRTIDYSTQATKLLLQGAVIAQSLTVQQINEYLERAEGQLEALQAVLRDDPIFQKLANTPLMLSVLARTYPGKSVEDIANSGSIEARRHRIFTDYVKRMYEHRDVETRYKPKQTESWLIWLAQQMKQRSQPMFYLEDLQIDWLSNSQSYHYHYYMSFAIGLLSFLAMLPANVVLFGNFLFAIYVALLDAFLAVPFVWLIGRGILRSTFSLRRERRFPFFTINKEAPFFDEEGKRSKGPPGFFERLLRNPLAFASLCGLLDGMLVQRLNSFYTWDHGLFYATFYLVLGTLKQDIQPAEKLAWLWPSARTSAGSSLLLGGSVGFILGLSNAVDYVSSPITFLTTLSFGLILGLAIGVVIMLMRGFSSDTIRKEDRIKPNQGIRNSLFKSTWLGGWSGLGFGFVVFFFYFLGFYFKVGYLGIDKRFPENCYLIYGVSDGLTVAYLYWLRNGGFACIQHLILRFCLWRKKYIPWMYVHFLDYADERILLRKVGGGGYAFIHDLLLEYFACINVAES